MKKLLFSLMVVGVALPLFAHAVAVDGCEPGYKFSATTGYPCPEVVDLQTLSTQIASLTKRVDELERQVKLLQSSQPISQQEDANLEYEKLLESLPFCTAPSKNGSSCKYYDKKHILELCSFGSFAPGGPSCSALSA